MVKTYGQLYLDSRRELLSKEDTQTAASYARFLLCQVSGKTTEYILAHQDSLVSEEIVRNVEHGIMRLLSGEPLAYVLGEWDFYGLPMFVSENVLIPRDDTCALTTMAIEKGLFLDSSPRILDLCCGTGCIGLAIASRLKDARVTLADISRDALAVAKRNIVRHKMGGRVACVPVDARETAPGYLGKFDMIVSNPPYITKQEMAELPDSVKNYEPHLALYGGEDGLDFYRSIVENFTEALKPGGFLCFEFGMGQGDDICDILTANGYTILERTRDYNDRERAVLAQYGRKEN